MKVLVRFTIIALFLFTFISFQPNSNSITRCDYYKTLNAELNYLDFITDIDPDFSIFSQDMLAHGGGLNGCGCLFNRKTGECHCHRDRGCGCECQPNRCE